MVVKTEWPFDNQIGEPRIEVTKRMVGALINRKNKFENQAMDTLMYLSDLGLTVQKNRVQQQLNMLQASTLLGVDLAWYGLLEGGYAYWSEIEQVREQLLELGFLTPESFLD